LGRTGSKALGGKNRGGEKVAEPGEREKNLDLGGARVLGRDEG